jgi:cell division protease FtsH
MDIKKFFKGWVFWVLLGLVAVWIGASLLFGQAAFKEVSVKHGLELLDTGKVASAKIIDGDQRVDLTLAADDGKNGKLVQFYYVAPRGEEIRCQ